MLGKIVNTPSNGGGNTYNFDRMFEGATFSVREEADIQKLAVELGKYVKASSRRVGEL